MMEVGFEDSIKLRRVHNILEAVSFFAYNVHITIVSLHLLIMG